MKRFVIVFSLAFVLAVPASADTVTPQAALERLFTSATIDPDWFAASFTAQVSVTQVEALIAQFKSQLGAYQGVHPLADHFSTEFEKASLPTYIVLDGTGRITGLLFKNPIPKSKDVGAVVDQLKALPGKVSILVLQNGSDRVAYHANDALAVGSAFKLAVLSALKKQIDGKRRFWKEIVVLRPQWKSLPSGVLQSWPDNSPLTVATAATLMISQSDNTAADIVLLTIGRSAVQAESPKRNLPFLTTRAAFQLKDPANAALLAKWRSRDELDRRGVLGSLQSRPLPDVKIFTGAPLDLDVEWFFSARELCAFMTEVGMLPLMSVNPGVADPTQWAHVAYKGGSEPGVLNLTTQLTSKSGKTYCVSATWNDTKALNEQQFELLYSQLLSNLE